MVAAGGNKKDGFFFLSQVYTPVVTPHHVTGGVVKVGTLLKLLGLFHRDHSNKIVISASFSSVS